MGGENSVGTKFGQFLILILKRKAFEGKFGSVLPDKLKLKLKLEPKCKLKCKLKLPRPPKLI